MTVQRPPNAPPPPRVPALESLSPDERRRLVRVLAHWLLDQEREEVELNRRRRFGP
jgi:hypothetical protein